MRSSWFTALAAGTLLATGCTDDPGVTVTPETPRAVVRYVNAVPDTVATDWRFIDRLTGSPVELALGFRVVGPYQAATPGSRPLRVFPATTNLTTQFFFVDQAIPLEANKRYTLAHVGMTRPLQTPADVLHVTEDIQPTIPAGKIAIRAVHYGAGLADIDIYVSKAGGTTPLPAEPLWSDVSYLESTPFTMVDPGPMTDVAAIDAIVGGYARDVGSFTEDGFTVGQQITAAGFATAANNGRSIVSSIVPRKTTGAVSLAATATGFTRTAGSFVDDGFTVGMPINVSGFSNPVNNGRFLITAVTPTAITVGTTTGAISLRATATTYVRTSGSFITDGFYVGMPITASGFTEPENNGAAVISNMTATTLTLAARTPATVVEAAAAGRTISRNPALAPEAEAPGRTIGSGELMMVNNKSTATVPAVATGAQTIVGELVYRATLAGSPTVIAEAVALTGLPAVPDLGQETIGGNTIELSALVGFLMPRSVSGSSAPQTSAFTTPTFTFAIDKHPR